MNTNHLTKNDKRKALWLGSIAGDAFVLGGHWIYDIDKLQSSFPNYDSPRNPLPNSFHKNKKLGDQTHYGDQARHLWQVLAETQGQYDPGEYREKWQQFIAAYDGYMDKASKESLASLKNGQTFGSGSNELGGTARLAAIYYWIEDPVQALTAAIDQNKMTHDSEEAVAITYLIASALQNILLDRENSSNLTAFALLDSIRSQMSTDTKYDLKLINEAFSAVNTLEDYSAGTIANTLGQSCHAIHALPALLAVLKQTDDYQEAMKLNVMIGGDSATRAMIIGALLGAKHGPEAIPQNWIEVIRD